MFQKSFVGVNGTLKISSPYKFETVNRTQDMFLKFFTANFNTDIVLSVTHRNFACITKLLLSIIFFEQMERSEYNVVADFY